MKRIERNPSVKRRDGSTQGDSVKRNSMSEKLPRVGSRVEIMGKGIQGVVAYVGVTHFSSGKWIGVVLDSAKGKNNGTVQGKTYFQCKDDHGIFVRQSQVIIFDDEGGEGDASTISSPSPSASKVGTPSDEKKAPHRLSMGKIPTLIPSKETPKSSGGGSTPQSKRASFVEKEQDTTEIDSGTNFVETVTHTFASGMSASQSMEDKIVSMQQLQEIDSLKAEVKDLLEKLETLKVKRLQDKEKLKEAEKTKIQVQQLLEFKARIMESQNELQKEMQKAKQEAKDAIEAKERHADEMADFTETMEMATLDKEMAEEKAETLQVEVEQLKERVEELSLDLEILRNEMSDKGNEGGASSYQVKQLEQQNERLKEALVKMRDLSAHEKREQQRLQKEIDQKNSEIAELSRTKEKFSIQADEYERQISELKEQVDAALGSEEMVEQLTERNLALEEKVSDLQDTVNDLEALHDMNEQLQENARETELELREELDMATARAAQAEKKVEAAQENLADYEQTIQKFRELTESFKERNRELSEQLEKATNMAVTAPAEMFDFKMKFAETKAHAKAIEMELRKIEVLQSNQHINYLCAFMTDAFLSRGGDHDSVLVLLLFPRMVWKAEILLTQIREKYPAPEEITKESVLKSYVVEQHSFSRRICHLLLSLQTILRQFNSTMGNCNVELFSKIGLLYPELAVQEKAIDFYIELLRKDQLDENINLETLEKSLNYFQSVYTQNLADVRTDCTLLLNDSCKVIVMACDGITTEVKRLLVLLKEGDENTDMAQLLKDLDVANEEIKQATKKIRRRMPQEGANSPVSFSTDVESKLFESSFEIGRVFRTIWEISHSSAPSDPKAGLPSQKIKELAHMATDKVYGKDDSGPMDCLKQSIELVSTEIGKIATAMHDGEYDFDGTEVQKPVAPLLLRSRAVKAEVKDLDTLKLKLEAKENDIMELKKAVKLKMDELSELHVRKDMVEKKLEVLSREQDDRLEKLQRKLDETTLLLRRKEKEFEETMDHLQADIDALESERGELKDRLKSMSKRTLIDGILRSSGSEPLASPTVSSSSPSLQSFVTGKDSVLLVQQMQDLRVALRHVKDENNRLRADQMKKRLSSLPPLRIPKKPIGSGSLTGSVNVTDDLGTDERFTPRLRTAYHASSQLLNDVWKFSTGMQVVNITKRKPATEQVLDKTAPMHHLLEMATLETQLKQRVEKLKTEVAGLVAIHYRGAKAPSDFSEFPTPQFTKMLEEEMKDGHYLGRLTLPGSTKRDSGTYSVIVEPDTFRLLHMKMIS